MLYFNDMIMAVLYWYIFIVLGSPKEQSADRHVTPLRHIILIPEPTSLYSFFLMLRAYQFTLPGLNTCMLTINHRCGSYLEEKICN